MAQGNGNGNGPRWSPNGNKASSGDFLGTTNAFPLAIKTNNVTRFTFDTNGDIIFNSLSSSLSNRLLNIDANGKLSALSGTAVANLLNSNGVGVLQKTGNDYFLPSGNLGIGIAPSPGFKLDVIGDARISNNLFVGGGIVITDKVQAATQVKGWDVKVDNDLNVTGASSFTGNTTFKGAVNATQGLDLGANTQLRSVTSGTTETLVFGRNFGSNGAPIPMPPVPCTNGPQSNLNVAVGGAFQVYNAANPSTSGLLSFQTWQNGCAIEATGNPASAAGLLFNYFCGSKTFINTGDNGGDVEIGRVGNVQLSKTTLRTANVNAFEIKDATNFDYIGFRVKRNGQTIINGQTQTTGPHTDAMLTVNGKMVARACYIRIDDWADYVFAKDYKVPNLYDIEKYYLANKHLPEIPSEKEIKENGIDVAEMNKLLLKKIEEMTIILVKQQKQIDELNTKVK